MPVRKILAPIPGQMQPPAGSSTGPALSCGATAATGVTAVPGVTAMPGVSQLTPGQRQAEARALRTLCCSAGTAFLLPDLPTFLPQHVRTCMGQHHRVPHTLTGHPVRRGHGRPPAALAGKHSFCMVGANPCRCDSHPLSLVLSVWLPVKRLKQKSSLAVWLICTAPYDQLCSNAELLN